MSLNLETSLPSADIIQEILDETDQWGDVPDIVPLAFKSVCHVLRYQQQVITEMEANMVDRKTLSQQMSLKANHHDVKVTMAEVAANIESRVSLEEHRIALDEKVSKADFAMRIGEKVTFEDMRQFIAQHGGVSRDSNINPNERNMDFFETDLRRIKT